MKNTLHKLLSVALGALLVLAFSPAQAQGGPPPPSTVPANPIAVPVEVSGALYGTVLNGGSSGYGAVWKCVESTGAFSLVCSFDGALGANPRGKLIYASDGYLYGTTYQGGNRALGAPIPSGAGGVFRVHPDGSNFNFYPIPYDYNNVTLFGPSPTMGLVEDPVGAVGSQRVFYGTTFVGGTTRTSTAVGSGTIYKLTVNGASGTFAKLYDFPAVASDGTNSMGAAPRCELVLQTTSTTRYLFGTAPSGGPGVGGSSPEPGGTVFNLSWNGATSLPTATNTTAALVKAFSSASPVGYSAPFGSLVLTSAPNGGTLGTMWGTLQQNSLPMSSISNGGGIFSIVNGAFGTAYVSSTAGMQYTNRGIQGGVKAQVSLLTQGQICLATDGYIYATSVYGGHLYNVTSPPYNEANNQDGTVYRVDSGGTQELVWVFRTDNDLTLCDLPSSGVIQASDGYLYGVTPGYIQNQGGHGNGALYRFPVNTTGSVTLVHQF